MTVGQRGLEAPKVIAKDISLAATDTTAEIDLNGGTLVGVSIPELTSTSFTIEVASATGGTFRTARDGFGLYGTEDTDISVAIGTTSVGYYPIPKEITYGMQFARLVFSASETATITVFYRSVE